MEKREIDNLVNAWIKHQESFWAFERLQELISRSHDEAWPVVIEITRNTNSDDVLGILAVGPMEDMLSSYGDRYIELIRKATMNTVLDHEARINAALGTVLRYFNFLELNLGLCIRFLENPKNPEQSHSKLARSSITDKLQQLKDLLAAQELIDSREEFDKWFQEASEARCVRNYYVHGTWEYLPLSKDPLGFRIPPWRSECLRGEAVLTMSLDELEADADQTRAIFERFMALRRKYGV